MCVRCLCGLCISHNQATQYMCHGSDMLALKVIRQHSTAALLRWLQVGEPQRREAVRQRQERERDSQRNKVGDAEISRDVAAADCGCKPIVIEVPRDAQHAGWRSRSTETRRRMTMTLLLLLGTSPLRVNHLTLRVRRRVRAAATDPARLVVWSYWDLVVLG